MKKLFYLLFIVLLTGCSSSSGGKKKNSSSSNSGQPSATKTTISLKSKVLDLQRSLVVVIPKALEKNIAKDSLYQLFETPQRALPQDEPSFNTIIIPETGFGETYRRYPNVVVIQKDKNIAESYISLSKNNWAKGQTVVLLKIKRLSDLYLLLRNNGDDILTYCKDTDLERMQRKQTEMENYTITKEFLQKYRCRFILPTNYELRTGENNFFWYEHNIRNVDQGIFIFENTISHADDISHEGLERLIIKQLKENAPGPNEGAYISLEKRLKRYYEPDRNKNIYDLTGIWQMENMFMAGPFVSRSIYFPQKKQLVTVFGWVYAPKFEKRNYTQQVEAIVKSFRPD